MKPLRNKIQLDIEEQKIGAVQSDAIAEWGTVVAVGPDVSLQVKKGDKIYFKAWAVDIITVGEDKHYFISDDSDAICAVE